MKALFTSMFLAVLAVSATGCVAHVVRSPAVVQHVPFELIAGIPSQLPECGKPVEFAFVIPYIYGGWCFQGRYAVPQWYTGGLVYAVYELQARRFEEQFALLLVGAHEIPEGRDLNASELVPVLIDRRDVLGIDAGTLVDVRGYSSIHLQPRKIGYVNATRYGWEMVTVRGMHPACESVDFQNIHLALEQDFRDHGPRWKQLIEPFLDEAYRNHTD